MTAAERWRPSPTQLQLPATAVHVWRARLDQPQETVVEFRRILAPDERERAGRFYFERDRRRYTVARGILRTLIGRYLDCSPTRVEFAYGTHDKPELAQTMARPDFEFNISHSQWGALFAFTQGRLVGVDIEQMRRLDDAEAIAERNFSADEAAKFRRVPESQKIEAFFNCWTRKEAFIKAIGEGLSHPLDTFDVAFLPEEEARFLRIAGVEAPEKRWGLWAIRPFAGFVGAVAAEGNDWQPVLYDFGNWRLEIRDWRLEIGD